MESHGERAEQLAIDRVSESKGNSSERFHWPNSAKVPTLCVYRPTQATRPSRRPHPGATSSHRSPRGRSLSSTAPMSGSAGCRAVAAAFCVRGQSRVVSFHRGSTSLHRAPRVIGPRTSQGPSLGVRLCKRPVLPGNGRETPARPEAVPFTIPARGVGRLTGKWSSVSSLCPPWFNCSLHAR